MAGIEHIDQRKHPSSFNVKKGGVGQQSVEIEVESQRGQGINSTFRFYFDRPFIMGKCLKGIKNSQNDCL